MEDARGPWNEVGDRLGSLALKLKLHAQEELTAERKAEARSAVERFGTTLQGAIDALGDAAKDPAVKEDAKAAGEALSTAVTATLDGVLKAFRNEPAGSEGTTEPAGSEGEAEPDAPAAG